MQYNQSVTNITGHKLNECCKLRKLLQQFTTATSSQLVKPVYHDINQKHRGWRQSLPRHSYSYPDGV